MKIYRLCKKFDYLGQCDVVRNNCVNEKNWQEMIKNKKIVDIEEFKRNCNYEVILDEDESLEEYISSKSDPELYFAKSYWGDKECYYLYTSGFEFIFV